MSITVTCGNCGVTLKTDDSAAGKQAKCPKCSAPIVVPMPVVEPEEPEEDYELEAPRNDMWDDFDQPSASADQNAAGDPDRKPCPACGEMIVAGAAKCRFCGEYFDASLERLEKKKQKSHGAGSSDENLSVLDWVLVILCTNIGCIVSIVYMVSGRPKGKKMFLIILALYAFFFMLGVILGVMEEAAGP